MQPSNNSLLVGTGGYFSISINNKPYCIHSSIYKNAFIDDFPKYIHVNCNEVDVKQIIYFMHCAVLQEELAIKNYKPNLDNLSSKLNMIDWCDNNLKQSISYHNFKQSIIDSIYFAIDIIKAGLTDNYDIDNKLKLLSELNLNIPDYIQEWILLPSVPVSPILSNATNMKTCKTEMLNNIKNSENDTFNIVNGVPKCFDNTIFNRKMYTLNITGNDIINMQDKLLSDIINREFRIFQYTNPQYLKQDNFNMDCEHIIYSLIKYNDLIIPYKSSSGDQAINIINVFKHGIQIIKY